MPRCPSCHRRLDGAAPCSVDGWTPPSSSEPPAPPPAPPHVEGVTLGERLGHGGFAVVWAGLRALDGAPVAVKVALSSMPMVDERFRREADAHVRVGPPHVARLHGRGRLDDGRPYLVMERLFGRTLAEEIASLPGPPDPDWVAARADAILAPLEAAHAAGVIHRDLKPENLFIARSGDAGERMVLLDFGLTKRVSPDDASETLRTRAGAVVGTPEYMAPEQLRGEEIDVRTDVYAFGVILFELLTLRLPFTGDGSAIEHGHLALRPPRPGELTPVPAALEELTLACLAKEPSRRPEGAAALRRALRAIKGAHLDAAAAPPPPSVRMEAPPDSTAALRLTPGGGPGAAKLIAEGRHPVVLLVADTSAPAAPVIAVVTGRKGFITRQRGARYVAFFSGKEVDDPAQAALAAARELVERHGARAALHLASVTIRRRERGAPAVYGTPVERPEAWLPAEPWSGLALTADFERAVPVREELGPVSVRTEPSLERDLPLFGRDDVLTAFTASAEAAFDGSCPGLFTLIGEPGLGKSRLAAEAAQVAWLCRPGVAVFPLLAAQPLPGESARESAELLRWILDAPVEPPAEAAAFCRERLGDELGEATWPAVAAALGWPSQASGGGAPASLHHGLVRALGEGLRRRAREGPVAVIVDDAHWADDALIDALEYATLDGAGVALWAVVIASSRFEQVRRAWGARTQRHDKVTLAPLGEEAAMAFAAQLLLPAEYPPAETLRRLASWSGGNPACLSELVRSLKRAGIVQRRKGADSYYVATAELDSLPPSPAWQWLATRQLDALPPELAACVRLCSVLGVSFGRAELEQVQDAIDRAGGAGTPIDAGYGLRALLERRILQRSGGDRCSFQSAVFQDAVYEMLDPAQREQIHRHALAFWRARVAAEGARPETLEPLARHAGACGAREEAAKAYLALGDIALARHRHVEADQRYGACLAFSAEHDARLRALALLGRGKSRYGVYRLREAIEDLSAARTLAGQLGDGALLADVLLEEATILDRANDFEASALRVDQVGSLLEKTAAPGLASRLLIGQGRTLMRNGRMAEAVELLQRGAEGAEVAQDHAAHILSLVLLSAALVFAGRLAEAEATFQTGIALAAQFQDWPHLCAMYVNRALLWTTKNELERAMEDMRRTIALAREIGDPLFERMATHNAAELLYANNLDEEALPLARRALVLEQRFVEEPVPESSLLLARILASRGDHEEAERLVNEVARSCPPDAAAPSLAALFKMLVLVLRQTESHEVAPVEPALSWDELLAESKAGLLPFELLELLYWCARAASLCGAWTQAECALGQAALLLRSCPIWQPRFDDLPRRLPGLKAATSMP